MLPVHGLHGHAQRSIFISIALFATFVLLLIWAQAVIGLAQSAAVVAQCGVAPATVAPTPCPVGTDYIVAVWRVYAVSSPLLDGGWIHVLLIGLLWVSLHVWWNSAIVRYETGATAIERRDAPELHAIVEKLAITAGIRCPHIEVVDSDQLDAYATGFTPAQATIGVTRGLVERLPRRELEAVIAHEIAHIERRDVRLMAIAKACSDLSFVFTKVILETAGRPIRACLVLGVLVLVIGPIGTAILVAGLLVAGVASLMFKALIARCRDLAADAAAVDLTRDAVALASALRRMNVADQPSIRSPVTQAMMLSRTSSQPGSEPSVQHESRLSALRQHARVTADEIERHRHVDALPTSLPTALPVRERRSASCRARMSRYTQWLSDGTADRMAKRVIKAALMVPIMLPVLMLVPAILLYLAIAMR